MEKKVKFAVVGAGHIGKRHAEMIAREPEAELVALVDCRSQEECDALRFEVPFFSTIDELLCGAWVVCMQSAVRYDVPIYCSWCAPLFYPSLSLFYSAYSSSVT